MENKIEWIDLGLPSGNLWASCNLGAEKPWEYGNYYMWGSMTPNEMVECVWKNAPFNGGHDKFNKKAFNESIKEALTNGHLNENHDVAFKETNGEGKMPTKEDFIELWNSALTDWEYVGGVYGVRLTSLFNGKKIFIPASGIKDDYGHDGENFFGELWSSTADEERHTQARCYSFNETEEKVILEFRHYGLCVRPIKVQNKNN